MASQRQDTADVEQDVYSALSKVFLLLDDGDRRFFAEHGLSARQFWALHHLDEKVGRPMMDLSRLLFTDKGNVTGIVDRLEKLGLVTRSPAPNDRRATLIKLTTEGRHVRDRINVQHEARVSDLLGSVERHRLELLLDLLSVVGENLESYLERNAERAPTSANSNSTRGAPA
jgi:DNA-binding MarR family transcriptional regulator